VAPLCLFLTDFDRQRWLCSFTTICHISRSNTRARYGCLCDATCCCFMKQRRRCFSLMGLSFLKAGRCSTPFWANHGVHDGITPRGKESGSAGGSTAIAVPLMWNPAMKLDLCTSEDGLSSIPMTGATAAVHSYYLITIYTMLLSFTCGVL
jgi:hypothetical protein